MIALRNNLIFGIVKKIILVIFTVIYKILALFNLQLTLLLSLVGLILFLTGAFDVKVVLVVFYVLIIFSIVLAVITTIKKVLGIGNKPKKSKGAQIIDTDKDRIDDENAKQSLNRPDLKVEQAINVEKTPSLQGQSVETISVVQKEKPVYYKVKQNPNFVMAEYPDRYELYKKTENGLVKVRVDKKN